VLNSLLTRVANFYDKDYLFASFLPSLIFHTLVGGTLAFVVGLRVVAGWLGSLTALERAAWGAAAALLVMVFGYVLNGMRGSFLSFWSGNSKSPWCWAFCHLGEALQARRYRILRSRSERSSPWREVLNKFSRDVARRYDPQPPAAGQPPPQAVRPGLSDSRKKKFLLRKAALACAVGGPRAAAGYLQPIVAAYEQYSGDSLSEVYQTVKRGLGDRDDAERLAIQRDAAALDRRYGSLETVRATALGNAIESYNLYPYKRYKMEATVFWPRLRNEMSKEYLEVVQDQRTLLDFLLTMASLLGIYGLMAMFLGPWLWYQPWRRWFVLALGALALSYACYRLALHTAEQLGELIRSSFDLFRLELMKSLRRPAPEALSIERAQWEELSELVVYGNGDFTLVKPDP
jgi:hypothetical protein